MPYKDPIKRKEYQHKWYLENKEEHNKKSKKYYEENKESILAGCKKYVEENKEKTDEYQKKYRDTHKEKQRKQNEKYRTALAKIKLAEKLSPFEETRPDPDNSKLLQVKCKYSGCQEWFNPTNQQVQNRLKSINEEVDGNNYFYCSDECKKSCLAFGQQKHPKDQKPYNLPREVQPKLRKLVLERDENTCQNICCPNHNKENIKLECHHIKPINESPIESADMDVCITLCSDCHKVVHQLPGCTYNELKC